MGYVPVKDRTTGWYLFNTLFQVRVNPHHMRTAEEIKLYGTPTTGNEDVDREMDKYEQIVMLPIDKIEAHYSRGYPVKFVKPKDCEEVYRLVQDHLTAMHRHFGVSEHFSGDPQTLAELVRLDQFADAVFQHARYGLRDNLQHAGFVRRARTRDPFAKLHDKVRNKTLVEEPKEKVVGASGFGREYGTLSEQPPKETVPMGNDVMQPDPIIEDPTLPRRTSLAKLFEDRRQMGTQWK